MFKKATKEKLKARIALCGPAGSGKTYTALRFAQVLAENGGTIAVIDTEHRSASKYTGESPDGIPFAFDVCELEHYDPTTYINVIKEAGRNRYSVIVIDSLSHAWEGIGGALDIVDRKAANTRGGSFAAWRDVTPLQRQLIETILASPCDIVATLRTKTAYEVEQGENGKMKPVKVGTKPIQREGVEYEFDVVGDLDLEHIINVTKARCPALDGQRACKPGGAFIRPLIDWLNAGVAPRVNKPVALSGEERKDPFSQDLTAPCGQEVAERIKAAAIALEMKPDQIKQLAAKVGASRLAEIPLQQAEKLLARLEMKLQDGEIPF